MNKFTKIFAVAAAALTISGGTLATSSDAHAFGKGKGKGLGLGIAAAVIGTAVGVIAASAAPKCKLVDTFDRRGNYRGQVEVCR